MAKKCPRCGKFYYGKSCPACFSAAHLQTSPDTRNEWDIYEIIPSTFWTSMPGLYWNFDLCFLSFLVTRNGELNQPILCQQGAGAINGQEIENLDNQEKAIDFEETDTRRVVVEDLTAQMQANGWEYFETGRYWYSRRFRKRA